MDTLDELYKALIDLSSKNELKERQIYYALNNLRLKFPKIWSFNNKLVLNSHKFSIEFSVYPNAMYYSADIQKRNSFGIGMGSSYSITTFDQITHEELEDMIRSEIQKKYNKAVDVAENLQHLANLLGVKDV